jgi:serine O-acetyltransferase
MPIAPVAACGTPEHAERDASPVSASVPDWSRETKRFWDWDPSRSLLASLRAYERATSAPSVVRALLRKWLVVRHGFWSMVTGAQIPLGCRLGGGLLLPHPNGVVIHPDVVLGPNCLVFQQVTLGAGRSGVPRLGGHVDIGAGAKILGGIVVGDHALIGANAVVLRDVPAGATAVGVPAVVIKADAERRAVS